MEARWSLIPLTTAPAYGSTPWRTLVLGEHSATAIAMKPRAQHVCQNLIQAVSVFAGEDLPRATNTNQAQAIAEKIVAKING